MAAVPLTFLLENVNKLLVDQLNLRSGAEKEVKLLKNELELMKAVLQNSADKGEKGKSFLQLERNIREAIYDAEDTFDTYLTHKSGKGIDLAKMVKDLRVNVTMPLSKQALKAFITLANQQAYGADAGTAGVKHEKGQAISRKKVVGFDDEEAIITDSLVKDSDLLDVIPIIGMPGLGKTTLALKIFQNEIVSFHFPDRIWINVSQKLNIKDVFIQILGRLIPSNKMHNLDLDLDELALTVRTCLERKKFLLVLDDIWTVDAWNEIKKVLPLSNGKSKVLLTSRDNVVGMQCASHGKPHNLRFLTGKESWTLLQNEVFGQLDKCPLELAEIGKSIALKCNGLPLAILLIGGILYDLGSQGRGIRDINAWKKVSRSVSDAIKYDNCMEPIIDVMKLSYNTLHYDVRDCFVYMGIFPEDYEVPVQMLLRLWIAEGFIQAKDGKSLEESGEEILNDLIRRNLLKAVKSNHMGKVKTCQVHVIVRAFCITKSKEQNSFREMKMSDTGEFPRDIQELRRLCLSSNLSRFLYEHCCPHMRSLMCFEKHPLELGSQYISVMRDNFPRLRILESKYSIKFYQFPAKVGKLIHLRYLTLTIDALTILPESISGLWNLQTLVVDTKTSSITMKANMWSMLQLRHLKTKAAIVLHSTGGGEAGENLQTLSTLSPDSCTKSISTRAKNLKTLGISGNLANIFKTDFFENLRQLEKLKLVSTLAYKPTSEDLLPDHNCFPPKLKRLTLQNTFLKWKHMSTLAKIDTLEVLKLKDNAFIGSYWNAMDNCFRKLQILLIEETDLVIWDASNTSFPKLECLVLKNCENLDEIPPAFAETLQKLDIGYIRQSAVDSANKIAKIKRRAHEHKTSKSRFPFTLNIGPVY